MLYCHLFSGFTLWWMVIFDFKTILFNILDLVHGFRNNSYATVTSDHNNPVFCLNNETKIHGSYLRITLHYSLVVILVMNYWPDSSFSQIFRGVFLGQKMVCMWFPWGLVHTNINRSKLLAWDQFINYKCYMH